MEESEKMTALKKAYAEIILNTAKEAAVRIMVSERRANQVHHDLSSTKEEAFRLLLRLKQTMDSKLNEADMRSLHQQRRIEELEAQLQEAEDIVSNLRADLNEAHIKMEEMEEKQMHNCPIMVEEDVCEERTREPKLELPETMLASQGNELSNAAKGGCITADAVQIGYIGVPNVPSSKQRELYKNGCTQRIRAYEGNLLNGHFSLSGELNDLNKKKTLREDQESENIYMVPLVDSDITHSVGKKQVKVNDVEIVDLTSRQSQLCKSFHKKRRGSRIRSARASLCKSVPLVAKEALADSPNSQTCLLGSPEMVEDPKVEEKDTKFVLPSTTPSIDSEVGIQLGDDKVTEAHTCVVDEDKEVASSLVLIRQQSCSDVCLDASNSDPMMEMKNVSSTNLNAEVLNSVEGCPRILPKDRVLKYTFQRKRKREALSSDDSSLLPQENPLKRKMGKKLNNSSLDAPKSSTVSESSRDSRRMAQVARQLISLSEKKWWK